MVLNRMAEMDQTRVAGDSIRLAPKVDDLLPLAILQLSGGDQNFRLVVNEPGCGAELADDPPCQIAAAVD